MDDDGIDRPTDGAGAPDRVPPSAIPPERPPTFVPAAPPAPSSYGGAAQLGSPSPAEPAPTPAEPGGSAGGIVLTRPTPTPTSMVAAGAGLLVTAGLFFLMTELDGLEQRGLAIGLSLLFVVLGVTLSTINRSTRAAAAGVAISALAVVPLVFSLFADADLLTDLSGGTFDGSSWRDLRGTASLVLASAAALWLLGYVLNPSRRFGFYLGAALVAIWLIPIVNIQVDATADLFSSFGSATTFQPVPTDPGAGSGFDSGLDSGSGSGSEFDSGSGFEADLPDIPDPSTKLGVVSLGFGAAYLAFAAARDRRRDRAMATAVLAPAIFILVTALAQLAGHVGWAGIGLLAIGVGGAISAVGLLAGRRASSWIGLFVATVGVGWLVARSLEDSPRAIGTALTVLGVAIALALGATARKAGTTDDPDPSDPIAPIAPTDPSDPTSATATDAADPFARPSVLPSLPASPPVAPSAAPAPHAPTGPSPTEERPPWSQPY